MKQDRAEIHEKLRACFSCLFPDDTDDVYYDAAEDKFTWQANDFYAFEFIREEYVISFDDCLRQIAQYM